MHTKSEVIKDVFAQASRQFAIVAPGIDLDKIRRAAIDNEKARVDNLLRVKIDEALKSEPGAEAEEKAPPRTSTSLRSGAIGAVRISRLVESG